VLPFTVGIRDSAVQRAYVPNRSPSAVVGAFQPNVAD
jgi:hypothetical protein